MTGTCPECGQRTKITTAVTNQGTKGVSHERRKMFVAHDHPDWPGQMCPGAFTAPPTG
jgi:hypothetical protein